MKISFVQKTANSFLQNKKATVLSELKNYKGEIIPEDAVVIILGKNYRNKNYLDIQWNEIMMNKVNPKDLVLVKEPEYWPIENDTLDLRNHEFNFKK